MKIENQDINDEQNKKDENRLKFEFANENEKLFKDNKFRKAYKKFKETPYYLKERYHGKD